MDVERVSMGDRKSRSTATVNCKCYLTSRWVDVTMSRREQVGS